MISVRLVVKMRLVARGLAVMSIWLGSMWLVGRPAPCIVGMVLVAVLVLRRCLVLLMERGSMLRMLCRVVGLGHVRRHDWVAHRRRMSHKMSPQRRMARVLCMLHLWGGLSRRLRLLGRLGPGPGVVAHMLGAGRRPGMSHRRPGRAAARSERRRVVDSGLRWHHHCLQRAAWGLAAGLRCVRRQQPPGVPVRGSQTTAVPGAVALAPC